MTASNRSVIASRATWKELLSMNVLHRKLSRLGESGSILRHPVFLATAMVVVIAGAILAILLRTGYAGELDEGRARAATLSRLLDEQTARSLQAVDLVLQSMADAMRTFTIPEHDAAFQQLLAKRLRALPQVRALFVIGADGFIIHDTDHPSTPRVSLADRDYFKFHQANPSDGLHIGKPLLSRSVNRWFVSVSRRVDRPDGSFGGIMVAAVEPAFYDRFLGELHLAGGDVINLLHADGTLIARAPVGQELVGQQFTGLRLFSEYLPRSPSGTYTEVSQADGTERIVSYRTVPGFPLVVTVALSRDAVLSEWRTLALASTVTFILVAGLGLFVAFVLVQRRIERRTAQERAVAAQKIEMLGQMTGGIAHDFNNVIAVADASLALAEKYVEEPSRARQHVEAARGALGRGAALTGRLLTFARRQSLEVETADLHEMLRGLEPMLRQAAGSGVSLTLDLAAGPAPCLVDRAQFDAALLNLVINARDAMPGAGSIAIITAPWDEPAMSATLKPGPYLRLQVQDTGAGMSAPDLERAFEPLFTTKGERGTGLGLAQVYGFMRHIGGDARIASQPGTGTTVELLFPCHPRAAPS